jgi:prolyl oligopeptidase
MAEYGDPDTSDWDDYLNLYSPYHRVDESADYPPVLFTTSTRDDRVHPAHARKMVKRLIEAGKGGTTFYYENIEGGHGGAADSKQQAFMSTLTYKFLWNALSKE